MSSKKQNVGLVNGEIYHICYRAVGDSLIFLNEDDHYRGIFSLYEFNNTNPTEIWVRRKQRKAEKKIALGRPTSHQSEVTKTRDKVVEILAFCFMSNHIHLLLKQIKDEGISQFMKKVGGGYAKYFNEKYQRKGHLFNRFKAIHVKDDNQLRNVVTYIHCNPIAFVQSQWKEEGISDSRKAMDFLENHYRWSSLWDYLGKPNFASVTDRNFLIDLIGAETIKEEMRSWILFKEELNKSMQAYYSLFLE